MPLSLSFSHVADGNAYARVASACSEQLLIRRRHYLLLGLLVPTFATMGLSPQTHLQTGRERERESKKDRDGDGSRRDVYISIIRRSTPRRY